MHNDLRGEISIELAAREYNLRPSFEALCEIENACGTSIINLLMKFDQRGIFLKEVVSIIKAGLKAGGHKTPKNLVNILHKQGFVEILPMVCQFLKKGLNL